MADEDESSNGQTEGEQKEYNFEITDGQISE